MAAGHVGQMWRVSTWDSDGFLTSENNGSDVTGGDGDTYPGEFGVGVDVTGTLGLSEFPDEENWEMSKAVFYQGYFVSIQASQLFVPNFNPFFADILETDTLPNVLGSPENTGSSQAIGLFNVRTNITDDTPVSYLIDDSISALNLPKVDGLTIRLDSPYPTGYRSVVLVDQPLAYWPLMETVGTVAHDITGHGFDGTIHSGVTLESTGPLTSETFNNAMTFDGSAGYISISPPLNITEPVPVIPTGSYTLEAWAKCPNPQHGDNAQGMIGYGPNSYAPPPNNEENSLRYDGLSPTTSRLTVQWGGNEKDAGVGDVTGWHHCACTFDGTTRILYFDGVSVASDTPSGQNFNLTNLTIGGFPWNATTHYFYGSLAHVAMYSYALSPSRVLAHSNQGTAIVSTNFGITRYTGTFNGTDDYVSLPSSLWGSSSQSQGTICAWIKLNNPTGHSSTVFSAVQNSTNYMSVLSEPSSGESSFQSTVSGATNYVYGGTLDTDWHFISISGAGSSYIVYLDGAAVSITTLSGSNNGRWLSSLSGTLQFAIGAALGVSSVDYFSGSIQNLTLWGPQIPIGVIQLLHYGSNPLGIFGNPIAWYPFNEGGGSTVHDFGLNAQHGTWHGSGTHWATR